ncbi:unnamed protein product, partial [Laminaria digitata]
TAAATAAAAATVGSGLGDDSVAGFEPTFFGGDDSAEGEGGQCVDSDGGDGDGGDVLADDFFAGDSNSSGGEEEGELYPGAAVAAAAAAATAAASAFPAENLDEEGDGDADSSNAENRLQGSGIPRGVEEPPSPRLIASSVRSLTPLGQETERGVGEGFFGYPRSPSSIEKTPWNSSAAATGRATGGAAG